MNERIRQFAKKSGFSLDSTEIYTAKLEHLPITENMEKFAELIVKEMCQVINADCELQFSQGVITNLGGLNQARELIKQHFGVE